MPLHRYPPFKYPHKIKLPRPPSTKLGYQHGFDDRRRRGAGHLWQQSKPFNGINMHGSGVPHRFYNRPNYGSHSGSGQRNFSTNGVRNERHKIFRKDEANTATNHPTLDNNNPVNVTVNDCGNESVNISADGGVREIDNSRFATSSNECHVIKPLNKSEKFYNNWQVSCDLAKEKIPRSSPCEKKIKSSSNHLTRILKCKNRPSKNIENELKKFKKHRHISPTGALANLTKLLMLETLCARVKANRRLSWETNKRRESFLYENLEAQEKFCSYLDTDAINVSIDFLSGGTTETTQNESNTRKNIDSLSVTCPSLKCEPAELKGVTLLRTTEVPLIADIKHTSNTGCSKRFLCSSNRDVERPLKSRKYKAIESLECADDYKSMVENLYVNGLSKNFLRHDLSSDKIRHYPIKCIQSKAKFYFDSDLQIMETTGGNTLCSKNDLRNSSGEDSLCGYSPFQPHEVTDNSLSKSVYPFVKQLSTTTFIDSISKVLPDIPVLEL